MTEIKGLIEDDKGNVIGAATDDGDVRFANPVKRSDWEKDPDKAARDRNVVVRRS